MGHFFKTQPNPKFLDPTQPIIDTWYGILSYTENLIQQLLLDPYADVDGVGGGVWVNFHRRRRRRADDF